MKVVAISADTSEESKALAKRVNLTFPLLSDGKAEVIRRYDLLVSGGDHNFSDIAQFLIDSSGKVRWRQFGEMDADRFVDEAKKL